ncbi:MAG TPA: DUF3426 domain-containing protein [Steroidobacter sp.]|nr:DUF3426 domain-containing protein [Steroidobacter sp.]
MLTQCPNCHTTFRLTSEILRVAAGQVRCGRCQTQFDALEQLADGRAPADVPKPDALDESVAERSAIEVEEPEEREDITLEGRRIEISGRYRMLDKDLRDALRENVREEWVQIEGVDAPTPNEDFNPAHANPKDDRSQQRIEAEHIEPERAAPASPELELLGTSAPRAASRMWRWLVAPLALLLALQTVHHFRAALARHPRVGAPMIRLYSALGLTLTPEWNLRAYEVRQWGVISDPAAPGTLKVRASVTNLAAFPQPYPLLKLVLEDRWGDQVRARTFEPAEYLEPGAASDRLLGSGQKTTAAIQIVDPGPDAEGFRFDVCLRGAQTVVCAEETPRP